MKVKLAARAEYRALQRSLVGVVGIAIGSTVLAGVIVLFGEAASMTWLPATPANVAAMQRCDHVQGTAVRRACIETVIAELRSRDAALRLAKNGP